MADQSNSLLVAKALELLGVPRAAQLPPVQDPTPKPEETEVTLSDSIPTIEPDQTSPTLENIPELRPGSTITWFSPLFGLLSGELLAVCEDGRVEVFNPVTETVTPIPQAWVRMRDETQR